MTCICCRIEQSLLEIAAKIDVAQAQNTKHFHQIIERLKIMANQVDQLRDDFRSNTDLVAARIDRLIAQITATSDNTASPETLADLTLIRDHLKALGTDPANPVPALPPAAAPRF